MATARILSTCDVRARFTPAGREVLHGLNASPKTLSPWLFYDAAGSALFEQITDLPTYYLTRTERQMFAQYADEIVSSAAGGETLSVIELGAGTASKTGLLLDAVVRRQGSLVYAPIDVSESALIEATQSIEARFPSVMVQPRVADYTTGLGRIDAEGTRRLVLYIGSSIGNFEPREARALLSGVHAQLAPGDQLLLGADQVKPADTLLPAYDDPEGVTAAFNRNVLVRINREMEADFVVENFAHEARWNPMQSRVEMHLRSKGRQKVEIAALGVTIEFADGETIHTENSYKFTDGDIEGLFNGSGYRLRSRWKDSAGLFGVYLAEVI